MLERDRANPRKGEDSSLSKITESQAIEIFNDTRKHKLIAKDYGIACSTVSAIKTGRNWQHLTASLLLQPTNQREEKDR